MTYFRVSEVHCHYCPHLGDGSVVVEATVEQLVHQFERFIECVVQRLFGHFLMHNNRNVVII